MVLLTLLLAGLPPPAPAKSHSKPVHKKQVPMMVVSPPPIIQVPAPMPVGVYIRRPSPPPPFVPVLTAPLDLAMVKQPKLDKFYPKELRKAGLEDSATVNLTIDRKGEVTECRIRSAPANQAFAEPACALGSKLRFARAINDYPWPLPIKIEWRGAGVALVRAARPTRAAFVPGSVAVSEDDYPQAMRRAQIEGREVAAVVVPPDGKAGECTIEWANVPPDFDAPTCRVLMRGHFLPARDEFGVAVPGRVSQAIRWKIAERDPIPALSYSLTVTLKVSAAGKMVSCTSNKTGPVPTEDIAAACGKSADDMVIAFPKLAGLSGRAVVVTIHSALTMDGDPPFSPVGPRTARATTMYNRTHFDIAPDGKTINCRVVEATGSASDPCADRMGPFTVTTGAARSGSYYLGIIIEPAL
jgi:TonB family protein